MVKAYREVYTHSHVDVRWLGVCRSRGACALHFAWWLQKQKVVCVFEGVEGGRMKRSSKDMAWEVTVLHTQVRRSR
jgi:hypothetical protein